MYFHCFSYTFAWHFHLFWYCLEGASGLCNKSPQHVYLSFFIENSLIISFFIFNRTSFQKLCHQVKNISVNYITILISFFKNKCGPSSALSNLSIILNYFNCFLKRVNHITLYSLDHFLKSIVWCYFYLSNHFYWQKT